MSFINDSILLLINVLHIIVIIFVLCAPFSGSNYLLFMHTIIVPFIMLHWVLNNNTCSLGHTGALCESCDISNFTGIYK